MMNEVDIASIYFLAEMIDLAFYFPVGLFR